MSTPRSTNKYSVMKTIILSLCLWLAAIAAHAEGTIILLVDISSSITVDQMHLQMDSYATAMRQLASLRHVNIEVVTFDEGPRWIHSGDNLAAATAFETFEVVPPEYRGSTCLGDALILIETMISSLPQPVVLDISGDGEANCSRREQIPLILDRMAAEGVRVNTLFVDNITGMPDEDTEIPPRETHYQFYQRLVRNGGFTIHAQDFFDFELALFEKLVLEVAQLKE